MTSRAATRSATKPLTSVAHEARRSAVLRQAAADFRRSGVAGADLPAIARSVGLSRASLYNYCSGREDLARRCYLDALIGLEHALDRVREQPGSGLERVIAFVRATVGQDRPLAAIAAELDLLPDSARAEIEREQHRAFEKLAALIDIGIVDRSIRRCEPSIAARTIWGLLSWTPLGEMWSGLCGGDLARRMEAELPELVDRGIVLDSARQRNRTVPADLFAGILQARPSDRVEEIARTASALFNRRGIEGVSLDDVAAALNSTKGLVYHHFASKAALVRHCFERGFEIYDQILTVAATAPNGLEQSRRGIALNAQAQLHALHPMSLNAFYRRLPVDDQTRFSQQTAALLDRSIAAADRSMADASSRRFDAAAVALASAGSFLFLSRWVPQAAASDPVFIASEVSDLFLYGLRDCCPT